MTVVVCVTTVKLGQLLSIGNSFYFKSTWNDREPCTTKLVATFAISLWQDFVSVCKKCYFRNNLATAAFSQSCVTRREPFHSVWWFSQGKVGPLPMFLKVFNSALTVRGMSQLRVSNPQTYIHEAKRPCLMWYSDWQCNCAEGFNYLSTSVWGYAKPHRAAG